MKDIVLSDEGKRAFRILLSEIIKENTQIQKCFPGSLSGRVAEIIEKERGEEIIYDIVDAVKDCAASASRFEAKGYKYDKGDRYTRICIESLTQYYTDVKQAVKYAMSIFDRDDIDAVEVTDRYANSSKLNIGK